MKSTLVFYWQQPGIGGEVVPHQDNSFLYTEPPTCTGLWLALEDATITNGCIWAFPGSQKSKCLLHLGSVWECVFKKIICIFKSNRNFGVFGIMILKTQILKL